MRTEYEAYRSACTLISNFGERAPECAGKFADLKLHSGDIEGYRDWRAVLRAIDEVLRAEPWPGERVH